MVISSDELNTLVELARVGKLGRSRIDPLLANAATLGLSAEQVAVLRAAWRAASPAVLPVGCPRCMRAGADCVCEGSGTF